MPDALLLVIAFVASATGMGWFALTLRAHWKQVRGDAPRSPAGTARAGILGTAALGASLALCLAADHASMAVLVWVMSLAAATLLVALALAWRPRWLRWLAAACH